MGSATTEPRGAGDPGETGPRAVVVTGAASGVGLAATLGLLADDYQVIGTDLAGPPPTLAEHAGLEWITGDVTETVTWDRIVAAVHRHDPDGAAAFLSCAGDMVTAGLLETTPDQFRRLFEINVLGTVLGLRALLPAMRKRRRGAVAVVGSVDSVYVEAEMSAYCASKAALLQVVRSAALEYSADGVRVNAVLPGAIDTPLLRRALGNAPDPDAELASATARIPSGLVLRPEEVAAVLRFLISDAASGITGVGLPVDGGLTVTYDYRPTK